MKKVAYLSLLLMFFFCLSSCSDNEAGNCSISCGGAGTGQPFVQTNQAFVTEDECRKLGEEKSGGCKASFCPPTGNSSDCYQVYP